MLYVDVMYLDFYEKLHQHLKITLHRPYKMLELSILTNDGQRARERECVCVCCVDCNRPIVNDFIHMQI